MKTLFILPIFILSFVALAETIYDQDFYASDFMNEVSEVSVDVVVPVKEEAKRAVAQKKMPKIQKVNLSDKGLINGEWEIVRVLDKDLKPVYDKLADVKDEKSKIIVKLDLIKMSTVRINKNIDQTYSISLFNKKGTIALFKPFQGGYEVLEARKIIKNNVEVKNKKSVDKRTKIEKRFERNQELTLISALHPSKNKNVLKGNNVSGSLYLMGDQVSFDGVALVTGKNDAEPLSFEAEIDGNTGHLNFNNEIQGIVSVVGDKEVKVRFSTGPLAGAMLRFTVQSEGESDNNNYEKEKASPYTVNENVKEQDQVENEVLNDEEFEEEEENVEFEDVSAPF